MDIQKMIDGMNKLSRDTRSSYHLTLGELISHLEGYSNWVLLEPGIGMLHSYRGHYTDLAFEESEPITVEVALGKLKSVLGTEQDGYKGGSFLMDDMTPLWISNYGDASGVAVMGLEYSQNPIRLKFVTKEIK